MKILNIILFACILMQPAQADWKGSVKGAWDNTKDLSTDTIDKSKDLYSSISGDVRVLADSDMKVISEKIVIQESKDHLKNIWPKVLEGLDDALTINTKIDSAPESAWFGDDKESLNEDQFELFAEIENLLSSPDISKNQENISRLKNKIKKERRDIALLKEKRIIAGVDERADLDTEIKKIQGNINLFKDNIDYQKDNLRARFQEVGLLLDDGQVDVLLSRVDSDDIIKMSVVYDVLADITKQLMELTLEFDEDINQARKYYGMHVVLLKMVISMQQSYITKLENEYLPKIDKIENDTKQVSKKSRSLLRSEKNASQRRVLENNIKAQQLTLKVAKLYSKQLQKQKHKVKKALVLAKKDYQVAKNTFDTVKLSAELIRLMKTNQASFSALMNIQIPEIVPFKNVEMQKKFEELSLLLKEG
ncbi:MAG: hypothetical protein V3U71_05870 [Cocleimonas sp.]